MKQSSFASAEYAGKKRKTRREKFLAEMETVVPWVRLEALIEPHYPKSGKVGRPPIGLSRMLRMYFLQQWYTLADEALEDALYDSQAIDQERGGPEAHVRTSRHLYRHDRHGRNVDVIQRQ